MEVIDFTERGLLHQMYFFAIFCTLNWHLKSTNEESNTNTLDLEQPQNSQNSWNFQYVDILKYTHNSCPETREIDYISSEKQRTSKYLEKGRS